MPLYLVECKQQGISFEQVMTAQRAAIEMCQRFTAEGKSVRYIRNTFIPNESHCLTLFEAPNAKVVQEVNEAAQIPFNRIVEAIELSP